MHIRDFSPSLIFLDTHPLSPLSPFTPFPITVKRRPRNAPVWGLVGNCVMYDMSGWLFRSNPLRVIVTELSSSKSLQQPKTSSYHELRKRGKGMRKIAGLSSQIHICLFSLFLLQRIHLRNDDLICNRGCVCIRLCIHCNSMHKKEQDEKKHFSFRPATVNTFFGKRFFITSSLLFLLSDFFNNHY